MVLCFLHQSQQEGGQITDFSPVQQMCVTKPVLTDFDNSYLISAIQYPSLINKSNLAHCISGNVSCLTQMTKLTKIEAALLALEVDELAGKQYVFQILVMPYNFTTNYCTFTVSAITEDVAVKTHSGVC